MQVPYRLLRRGVRPLLGYEAPWRYRGVTGDGHWGRTGGARRYCHEKNDFARALSPIWGHRGDILAIFVALLASNELINKDALPGESDGKALWR